MAGSFGGLNQSNYMTPRKPRTATTTVTPTGGAAIWGEMAAANQVNPSPFGPTYANPQNDVLAAQQKAAEDQARRTAVVANALQTLNRGSTTGHAVTLNSASTPMTTGTNNRTTPGQGDMWDGFARRYVPGEQDLLWEHPEILLRDYLGQNGRKDNMALEGDMQRYADIALPLYHLLVGGNMDPAANKSDSIINWIANNFFKNMTTPGGRAPTTQQMLNMLYSGFSDKDSILGQGLYDGEGNPKGTDDQINAIMAYLPLLGEFSDPIYASAIRNRANAIASDFRADQANGKAGGADFLDYLRQNFMV